VPHPTKHRSDQRQLAQERHLFRLRFGLGLNQSAQAQRLAALHFDGRVQALRDELRHLHAADEDRVRRIQRADFRHHVESDAAAAQTQFIDRGEYVEDRQTGLLWQKDGQASGKLNFHDAAKYAKSLKLGGLTGWRVPTAKELESIFPADKAPFANSAYNKDQCCAGEKEFRSYWTSELDTRLEDYAFVYHWYAKGGANNCFASKNFVYVRCVLDAKSAVPPGDDKPLTEAEAKQAREHIVQLGSDDFAKREAAAAALQKLGRKALPLLSAELEKAADAEVRFRLKQLVKDLGG